MTTVHFNQPRFLPDPDYLARFLLADVFVFRDDVQFQPKDWENRNRIKTPNGPMWLTVPLKSCPIGTPLVEATIDHSTDWRRKMLRAVELNYARAPHFKEFFPQFRDALCELEWQSLFALNLNLIDWFREIWELGERCETVWASDLRCTGDTDEVLIAMCKKLGARTYL